MPLHQHSYNNLQDKFSTILITLSSTGSTLPLIISPTGNSDWQYCIDDIKKLVEQQLHLTGGLLFRGFSLKDAKDFNQFAQSFGHGLLNYDYASTPRSEVTSGVYTSTEYPAHQEIPLHNEQSYTLNWPMKIWFHCITASPIGGATPIANSREIYRQLSPEIRDKFEQRKLLYIRNYGNGLDLPWQKAFGTESKTDVESFCRKNDITFIWKDDGELQTKQICQASAKHPITKEFVWFNQAHLFHISNLEESLRETLISIVGESNLPRNVYYGDGTSIEESALTHIREIFSQCKVSLPWQQGDIMMLDNMLSAHGRDTFEGSRKVIVAMAESNQ